MSIRTYDFPRKVDLSPGLQSVLAKNGMQAHIVMTPTGGHKLVVMGHDSPVIEYGISEKQVEAMMNWGNNYANKKAYNTFNSIISKDFDTPKNFVRRTARLPTRTRRVRIPAGMAHETYRKPCLLPYKRHGS